MSGAPERMAARVFALASRAPPASRVVSDLDTGSVLGHQALELEGFVLEALLPEQLQLGIDALRPDDLTTLSGKLELGQVLTG